MIGYIYSNQEVLFGKKQIIGFGSSDFYVKQISKSIANNIIIKNHYSHKVCFWSDIQLGCYINGELLGILQYGTAMNSASMGSIVKDGSAINHKELNRMWFDDKAERNTESKAISYSIKYIKANYPKVKFIQSFADERCKCLGVVYQASNFDFYGSHNSIFWEFENEIYHNMFA